MTYYNDDIIKSFSPNEYEDLFNKIVDMFFHRNFGSVSKSDLETYIFSFYLEHLINTNENFDDYTLGRDLGLTISRVRALKERKELKYPHEGYDWKESFLECAKYAKYDEVKHLIKFTISDVNVMKDVRNFFVKHQYYDEYQLNPNLFQCRLDIFLEAGRLIAEEKGEEFKIDFDKKKIKNLLKNEKITENQKSMLGKLLEGATEEGIKELLKDGGRKILVDVIKTAIPGMGVAGCILDVIRGAIEK